MHHLQIVPFLHHGYLAVEFFFILSGLLLCKSYCEKKQSIKTYFVGRIKKLYPQYFFALIVITLYLIFRQIYHGTGETVCSIVTSFWGEVFLLHGIVPNWEANNYPTWYVSVLLWGGTFIFMMLKKLSSKWIFILSPIFIIGYYVYNFSVSNSIEIWTGVNPLLRGISDMLIGVLLYLLLIEKDMISRIRIYSVWMKLIGLAGMAWCFCSTQFYDMYAIFFLLVLIVGSICSARDTLHLNKVSKYCYSMYLTHALVIDYVRRLLKIYVENDILVIIGVLLSILFYSILFYVVTNWLTRKLLGANQ